MKASGFILLILLFLFSGCGILGSDDRNDPEPGPRNYSWTVDTLYSPPGGFVYDIWGSSPEDVWAVLGTGINTLWHFDGQTWKPWSEQIGPALYTVFGYAKDEVFIGGNDGKIYQFDGNDWKLSFQLEIEEARLIDTYSIWGELSNLFIAGIVVYPDDIPQSFIFKYDEGQWGKVLITDFKVQLQRLRTNKDEVFLQGININSQPDSMFFYTLEGDELREVYSASSSRSVEIISLNKIGDEIYFVVGNTINRMEENSLVEWRKINEPDFGYQIYGRNEKDIFLRMDNGLAHFNGEDIEYLFEFSNSLFSISNNAMIFEKEVFFLVNDYDAGTNLIYHGTLSDEED